MRTKTTICPVEEVKGGKRKRCPNGQKFLNNDDEPESQGHRSGYA